MLTSPLEVIEIDLDDRAPGDRGPLSNGVRSISEVRLDALGRRKLPSSCLCNRLPIASPGRTSLDARCRLPDIVADAVDARKRLPPSLGTLFDAKLPCIEWPTSRLSALDMVVE